MMKKATFSTISKAISGAGGLLAGSALWLGPEGLILGLAITLGLVAVGAYLANRAKMKIWSRTLSTTVGIQSR